MKNIVSKEMILRQESDHYVLRLGNEAQLTPSFVVWLLYRMDVLKEKHESGKITDAAFDDYFGKSQAIIDRAKTLFKKSIKNRVHNLYMNATVEQKKALNPFKTRGKTNRNLKPLQSTAKGKKIDCASSQAGIRAIENVLDNWNSFVEKFKARGDDIIFDPGNGWKFQIVADEENPLTHPGPEKMIPQVPVDDVKIFLAMAVAFPGAQLFVKNISKNRYARDR